MAYRKLVFLILAVLAFVTTPLPVLAQSPAPSVASPAVSAPAPAASPVQVATPAPAASAPAPVASAPAPVASPAASAPAPAASPAAAPASPVPAASSSTLAPQPIEPPVVMSSPIELPNEAPTGPRGMLPGWLQGILLFLYFGLALGLVLCVMFTTTKSEGGLTGIIGGQTQTTIFKGKKSAEEQLSVWTTRLAWTFLFSSLFIWILLSR